MTIIRRSAGLGGVALSILGLLLCIAVAAAAGAGKRKLDAVNVALVSTADGSGKNIYTRDRAKYRRMLRESVRLHAELQRRWPELQKQYRDAQRASKHGQ